MRPPVPLGVGVGRRVSLGGLEVRGSGRLYLLLLLGLAAVDADGSEDEAPIAPSVLKEDAADDADADASALDTSG